jgi:hypothetical protein
MRRTISKNTRPPQDMRVEVQVLTVLVGHYSPCETGRISVVSDRLTVPEHDGVHRTKRTGRRINTIEVFEDELFTRMGDIEPVVARETRGGDHLPDIRA